MKSFSVKPHCVLKKQQNVFGGKERADKESSNIRKLFMAGFS